MKTSKLLFLIIAAMLVFAMTACSIPGLGTSQPCEEHTDADSNGRCDTCGACTDHVDNTDDGKCDMCGTEFTPEAPEAPETPETPEVPETHIDADMNAVCDECEQPITFITVAEALELCGEDGNVTEERYYLLVNVDSVTKAQYGAMKVSDETGSISVYGTYSADGSVGFAEMESTPKKGDTVAIHCILQNFNGNKEIKNARLIGYTDNSASFDESIYTVSTVAEARAAEAGALVIVEGVVARITYSTGENPAGVILVDGTQSIYVYDVDLASQVSIGNKVKIAGEKDFWILDKEQSYADKFGYKGCNQITDAYVLSNDNGSSDFDKSWISETTVMDIMETPITEDITTSLYKVTALVSKVQMPGFVNYYINDLDGTTGTYVYTQCNGSDFGWLDEFDAKICTVYLTALNAKSTNAGCSFRFLPVSVEEIEGFTFPAENVPEHVIKYNAAKQFISSYSGDPALELINSASSELLGFENAAVSYTSSNESVITFTVGETGTVMNCVGAGVAEVTIKVVYNGIEATKTLTITVTEAESIEYITVADAIAAELDSEVVVKGIVGASLVNKVGFYLVDETGTIAVLTTTELFKSISVGDEIILKGKRTTNEDKTQIYINDGELVTNNYGDNALPTDAYDTTTAIGDVFSSTDTTKVYVVKAKISKAKTTYYTNYYLHDAANEASKMLIYSSNGAGLGWLDGYIGEEITLEIMICNWNGNGNRISVISVVTADGKVINNNNFDRYGANAE